MAVWAIGSLAPLEWIYDRATDGLHKIRFVFATDVDFIETSKCCGMSTYRN